MINVVNESQVPEEHRVPPICGEQVGVDYVQFELLMRVQEASLQQLLKITAGPVRVNPETNQRESMRIDLGQCVRRIAADVVEDDPRGRRFIRSRFWICIEILRLVCTANSLDCRAFDPDEPNAPPVEWVVCLVEERAAEPSEAENHVEDRTIEELVDFIDGKTSTLSKKKSKNKDKPKEATKKAVNKDR